MYMLLGIVIGCLALVAAQLEYPESSLQTDKRKGNANGRIPLYSPSRCGTNQLLYPGDQETDWICDCAPTALYHPESDSCQMAFRRGPCPENQILVLGREKIIPECIENACKVDGQIMINHICYTFGQAAPCRHANLSYVLGVDPDSLEVNCVRQSIALKTRVDLYDATTAIPDIDLSSVNLCARGTKRHQNGKCQ